MANSITDDQKEVISQAVLFAKNQGTSAEELSLLMRGGRQVGQDDDSRYIVQLFQDPSSRRLREIGNATDEQLRQEMVSQLNEAYKTDDNPQPFAALDVTQAPRTQRSNIQDTRTQRSNITEHQRRIIEEAIDPLNDINVNTRQLSRQLNREEPVDQNDRSRFIVQMFQDPRRGRLRDMGSPDTTDADLRQEMLRQLTETFRTNENPEPFSSVDPNQRFGHIIGNFNLDDVFHRNNFNDPNENILNGFADRNFNNNEIGRYNDTNNHFTDRILNGRNQGIGRQIS